MYLYGRETILYTLPVHSQFYQCLPLHPLPVLSVCTGQQIPYRELVVLSEHRKWSAVQNHQLNQLQ